ncbi:hypothetical protein FACS1894195_0860 [Bacteroidia bacterium]|nr:hypothetical protein FACS1894195_0860 [Bacteroidia bacterium]
MTGYLANVLEIVDGTYKFAYKFDTYTGEGTIQVKIKSIKKGNTKDYGLNDGNYGPLYLSLCDANGMPLADFSDIWSDYKGDELLKNMLSKVGEENWIKFELSVYKRTELPIDVATFIITSKKKEEDKESTTTSSKSSSGDNNETASSSKGNTKYDKMLDDYEKYVDEYIKFYKKAMAGDQSALLQYPKLLEKTTKLSDSMEKIKDDEMSPKQITRYMEITLKLTDIGD